MLIGVRSVFLRMDNVRVFANNSGKNVCKGWNYESAIQRLQKKRRAA